MGLLHLAFLEVLRRLAIFSKKSNGSGTSRNEIKISSLRNFVLAAQHLAAGLSF